MSFPALLRYSQPYLLSILNTWGASKQKHKFFIRLTALCLFIIFILLSLREQFFGRQSNLQSINNFSLFNPLLLQVYWSLLLIAGSISAVFQIYQSKKTDYILSHPFYPQAYYLSMVFQLIMSLAFISLTVGVPLWILHLKISSSIISGLLSLLTLLIINFSAASCAVLIALLIGPLIMHPFGRKVFLGILFCAIFGIFLFTTRLQEPSERESLIQNFSALSTAAQPVIIKLQFSGLSKLSLAIFPDLKECGLLVAVLILPLLLGILIVEKWFHKLYEVSQSFKNKSLQTKSLLIKLFSSCPSKSQTLTLIGKEYQLIFRDALNVFQLLLILLVLLVYILSLFNLPQIGAASSGNQEILQSVLIAVNYLAVLLIVSVIAARFAFPAFSIENGSFWLIASSSLTLRSYYKAKFLAWFIIIVLIAGSGILISNYIILASWQSALLLSLPAILSVYGLVSLAFGLGAYFIKLEWENITELTSGFGNFLYLLSSFIFIILNLVPNIFLILLQSYSISGELNSYSLNEVFFYVSIFSLIVYFNLLTGKFCRELAIRSIERKILT